MSDLNSGFKRGAPQRGTRSVIVSGNRRVYADAPHAVFEDSKGQDHEGGCLFIAADVTKPGWSYCKAPRIGISSYCREHTAKCKVPIRAPTGRPFRLESPKSTRAPRP